jgi:multiple sugar transport system permease protein
MMIVFGIPLLFSLFLSTQGWNIHDGMSSGRFVGSDNFSDLVNDIRFLRSAILTIGYTAATVAMELLFGLCLALLLNLDLKFISFFRTVLVVPMMMTPIVAALCWKLLLDPKGGLINYLIGIQIIWLGDSATALFAVAFVNIWQNSPYAGILLLAGLRSLPREPLEAALIDGASWWQSFRYVILPLLKRYILVALLLRTIFEFRSFDNVYVMTSGGPGDATMLLSIFTYMISFLHFDLSLGAAASWMMLLMVLLACAALILIVRRGGSH